VPAANVVISYDHMKDSVELCQRSGRARQQDSSIVILDERPDRPLSALETARNVQDDIVARYEPSTAPSVDQGAERTSQLSREHTAYRFIFVDKNQD
jgi:ERCC4-related helicase